MVNILNEVDIKNILNDADIIKNILNEADIIKNNLHKMKVKYNNYSPFIEPKVSLEDLNNIKINYNDLNVAKDISDNINRIAYFRDNIYFKNILKEIKKNYPNYYINSSGLFLYPPNAYCGWHTNSNNRGNRLYLSYCVDDNKSFFRYIDPETNELCTKWEKKGWNVNEFTVNAKKKLWHCVYSSTIRLSIGINIIKSPIYIHIGRCGGSSLDNDMNQNDIIFQHIHMRTVDYDKDQDYIIIIRNPIDRFVSAFNWVYYRITTPSYYSHLYERYLKNNPTINEFNYYKNANYIGENIYNENNELNIQIDEFINRKGITPDRINKPGQLGFGIYQYLCNFINKECASNCKVISYHSLINDCKNILNIDLKSHMKKGSTEKLSELACKNLEKYFKKDFECIEKLYNLNLINNDQFNSLMFNHRRHYQP